MHQPSRSEDRVPIVLPVSMDDGASGVTRDISASGIYFETDRQPVPDQGLAFSVELNNGTGGLTLRCRGQIVRVERLVNRYGVAARILESKLEPGRARQPASTIEISDGFADSF